ncbi:carboxymuconolactone decarboxylase family protein [Halomicrococcus sp. NG-SE-24]|uniref:carboxymuconolactone decarboxylase family protein n=1 Tax=Halomicrococcus sp. NG-SE-24 TaxID=3436928 RepID=UPI003D978CB5
MSSRPKPLRPTEIDDERAKELLKEAKTGWYGDTAFFGAMAHVTELLKQITTTLQLFPQGQHINTIMLELMRLKIAECHQCAYCATVRTIEIRDEVAPKEDAVFGEVDKHGLTHREYLAVSLAEKLSEDPHKIQDSLFENLQNALTEGEIIELLLFASLEIGLDRFCIALELNTTDDSSYPDLEYPLEDPRPKTEY